MTNNNKHDPDPEDTNKYATMRRLADIIKNGYKVSFTIDASQDQIDTLTNNLYHVNTFTAIPLVKPKDDHAWKLMHIAEPLDRSESPKLTFLHDKVIVTPRKRKYKKRVPKLHHIQIYKLHNDRFRDYTQLITDEIVTVPNSVYNRRIGKVKPKRKRKQNKK